MEGGEEKKGGALVSVKGRVVGTTAGVKEEAVEEGKEDGVRWRGDSGSSVLGWLRIRTSSCPLRSWTMDSEEKSDMVSDSNSTFELSSLAWSLFEKFRTLFSNSLKDMDLTFFKSFS